MPTNHPTNNDKQTDNDFEPEDDLTDMDFDNPTERTGAFRLEQYMKAFNIAASGGQAKVLIQSGQVKVNGKVEIRRKRQLQPGDRIEFLGDQWIVDGS